MDDSMKEELKKIGEGAMILSVDLYHSPDAPSYVIDTVESVAQTLVEGITCTVDSARAISERIMHRLTFAMVLNAENEEDTKVVFFQHKEE